MPIEGPLRELDIHDVFQLLDLGRKTGVLRIRSELRQDAGRVIFHEGAVVAADMLTDPEPLGPALLRAGRISQTQLGRARALQQNGDARRLGEVLVGIGAIARAELERVVRVQVEDVLFTLMSWKEGYFTFEETPLERAGVEALVRIPTEAILMEAARRIDEWSRIAPVVAHAGVRPLFADGGEDGSRLDLVPAEWEVLAMVDGERDVRGIAQVLGRSEFEVAKTMFGLATTGVVLLEDPAVAASAELAPVELATARSRVDEYLAIGDAAAAAAVAREARDAHPDDPAALLLAGRAALHLRRWEEAATALSEAVTRDPDCAAGWRLLGLAEAARGRFEAARDVWHRWRAAPRSADEVQRDVSVDRLEGAVATLVEALRGPHV